MAEEMEVGRLVEFLRKSELVNLEMPVSKVIDAVSELAPPSGQVLIWTQWIFVSPPCPQGSGTIAIGERIEDQDEVVGGRITLGEGPEGPGGSASGNP